MKKKDIILFSLDDAKLNEKLFIRKNAFIKPDGTFYLAKGYSGNNYWQQVESSALWIGRKMYGDTFIGDNKNQATYPLFDKRSILIHYYGLALFCRTELIGYKDLCYADRTQVPDPKINQKELTEEQLITLRYFFALNESQNISAYNGEKIVDDTESLLKLALERKHWNS